MRSKIPRAHKKTIKKNGTSEVVARLKLPVGNGQYTYKLLGPWGEHLEEEARVVAEWRAARQTGSIGLPKEIVTVAVLASRYLTYAKEYYQVRPIGENDKRSISPQYAKVTKALSFPLKIYKNLPAEEFGPLALEASRELMIDDGLTREYINSLVGCIQRAWGWACSKQLVSANCHNWLLKVEPLAKRRCRAPEGPGTPPILEWEVIKKTLDHCPRTIAAMIQTQYQCCMRPEEVCILRKGNIETKPRVKGLSVEMWGYYPGAFKGDHLGNTTVQEVIAMGPKAIVVLKPFYDEAKSNEDYLFSPIRAQEEELAKKRALRKSKVQPSQMNRKKRKPLKSPGVHYMPDSYRQAVHRACDRAGVKRWSPAQLRHTRSTEIREKYDGIDVAQLALRHKHAKTSEIYAKLQVKKAFELMAKEG